MTETPERRGVFTRLNGLLRSRAFRWLVTLGLLGTMVWWVRPASVLGAFAEVRPALALLALAVTVPYQAAKITRWHLLINRVEPHPWTTSTRSFLGGLALAVVTPSSLGEFGRAWFVPSQKRGHLFSCVVLDKLIDLWGVLLNTCLGLLLTGDPAWTRIGGVGLLGLLAATGLGMGFSRDEALFRQLTGWLPFRLPELAELVLQSFRFPLPVILTNVALAEVGFALLHIEAYILLLAFAPDASLSVIVFFPLITLSTILPIGVGGLGVREWAGALLLGPYGIPQAIALNTFFLHYATTVLLPALVGAIWLGGQLAFSRELPAPDDPAQASSVKSSTSA